MRSFSLYALAIFLLLVAGPLAAFAAETKGDAVKKDIKLANGTWSIASMEVDGEKVPQDQIKGITVVLADGKFTVKRGDELVQEGTSKVDPTKKPKTIDVTTTKGQNAGENLKGIYEIDGDSQKLCFAPQGKDRPTEFASRSRGAA